MAAREAAAGRNQDDKPRRRASRFELPHPAAPLVWRPPKERDLDQGMQAAMPELKRLERYERRAWSRRHRALKCFTKIKSDLAEDIRAFQAGLEKFAEIKPRTPED